MKNLLNKIDPKILLEIIGKDRTNKILSILNNNTYRIDLSEIIFALYGQNIFENKTLRKEIIKLLPEKKLIELTEKYCGKVYSSKESNAIQLSAKNWTSSNRFPFELINALGINLNYLPHRIKKFNVVDIIEPVDIYYPLFDYQREIKNQIKDKLELKVPRFIIQMPTGSGKTKTCLESLIEYNSHNFIIENNNSFLWIAHTEELCEQAISSLKTIWQHTQHESLRIIRYWGGYEPTEEELYSSFIFSSYQKLSSRKSYRFLDILSNTCKVVIVDEAHKSIANTYSKMLNSLCSRGASLIGLTATPGRSAIDKLDNSDFAQYFNKQIIVPRLAGNPIKALQNMKILSNLTHNTIESHINLKSPDDIGFSAKLDFSSPQLKMLSINPERNKLIVSIIDQEIKNNNSCLVFTCSVEHSVILTGVLKFLNIKAAYVDSVQKKSQRRKIVADFKDGKYDVLLNFGVLTTGFDAPRIKTVIITRPTTSIVLYSQMIGRALRGTKVGGNEKCRIIDIKDNFQDFGPIEEIYDFFSGYWD